MIDIVRYAVYLTIMREDLHKSRASKKYLPETTDRRLVILTGARQTGKTTLVGDKYKILNYVDLDSPENRQVVNNIHSAPWRRSTGNAALDEAQKAPVVSEKVKYEFDEGSISFSVLKGYSQILVLKI